ncbi:MAG: glucose 1-dehydrogenase [Candidatus Latescibacteria bacterium]|jgi:3-oxoacyl-[acyl-carrier protein] reductase|nr:glucose 1-dehydrogenase [Candidatus Latescibacterota bacterium]
MKLEGKVAIVTGGGTGIGSAAALLMAAEGARVCVSGRRPSPLAATVDAITSAGGQAMAVSGNVASAEDTQRLVQDTLSTFGRLDILVTSAGTANLTAVADMTESEWDETLETNLKGTFLAVKAVLPTMVSQASGTIVTVSSILGQRGMKGAAAYGASKAGIEQFTKVVALEHAGQGIRANTIAPGWVETPMTDTLPKDSGLRKFISSRIPAGRFGEPEEIAHAVLYLASDEACWITGTVLTIDGGWKAQ